MDLRHDLSLRSSRFPLILHEVEKRFGLTLRFDDLLGVATVRDLADRIRQLRHAPSPDGPVLPPATGESISASAPPLLPESGAPGEEAVCAASRHFSHFRDLWLKDARPWPDFPHACLPPSMQLAALMEGAVQAFPGFTPAGAEELFFSLAQCPSGVTREGHVLCRALRDQAGQRQCQGELHLRDLMPNGRARRSFSPVCSARILLMQDAPKTRTPFLSDPATVSASALPDDQEVLRNFYARHTGLGPSFRLLMNLHALEEKRLIARMRVPSATDVAGLENVRYIYPYHAFEAAAQAALLLALKRVSGQDAYPRLALSRVLAARFSRGCIPGEALELELRDNADGLPMHFDAELRDAYGHIVLALRGICLGAE
jgi:hypothetical protein